MVKRKRIARKPQSSPAAEHWVTQGGLDPEIKASSGAEIKPSEASAKPEKDTHNRNKGKAKGGAYPHRISFDLDTSQYKRLKWAAFDTERSMNELIREALEDWLISRDY